MGVAEAAIESFGRAYRESQTVSGSDAVVGPEAIAALATVIRGGELLDRGELLNQGLEHLRRFALPLSVRRALGYSWYLSDSGQGWQTSRAGRHGILAALTSQLPSAIGNPW